MTPNLRCNDLPHFPRDNPTIMAPHRRWVTLHNHFSCLVQAAILLWRNAACGDAALLQARCKSKQCEPHGTRLSLSRPARSTQAVVTCVIGYSPPELLAIRNNVWWRTGSIRLN
jgi:hypothetical protein